MILILVFTEVQHECSLRSLLTYCYSLSISSDQAHLDDSVTFLCQSHCHFVWLLLGYDHDVVLICIPLRQIKSKNFTAKSFLNRWIRGEYYFTLFVLVTCNTCLFVLVGLFYCVVFPVFISKVTMIIV